MTERRQNLRNGIEFYHALYFSGASSGSSRISVTGSSGAVTRINPLCCMAKSFISKVGT